jgi:hypothetical protein
MSDIGELMREDAASTFRAPTDEDLKTVGELAHEQLRLEKLLEEQEEVLRTIKDQLTDVREFKLPNAVEKFGFSEFKLKDGSSVTIKEEVYAGITDENKPAAFEWLAKTGNDGLIKNEVKCPFGKGQDQEAKLLVDLLNNHGYSFTNSRTIHPQTLKAFVKHQMEDGKAVPMDIFSIHVKKIANIKQPKR